MAGPYGDDRGEDSALEDNGPFLDASDQGVLARDGHAHDVQVLVAWACHVRDNYVLVPIPYDLLAFLQHAAFHLFFLFYYPFYPFFPVFPDVSGPYDHVLPELLPLAKVCSTALLQTLD